MINGVIRFSGLVMAQGSFDFTSATAGVRLKGKAAFVDPTTGRTHGWTEAEAGWSKETTAALETLREAMEKDLARVHLVANGESDAISATQPSGGPSGLGEHLGAEGDVPQV